MQWQSNHLDSLDSEAQSELQSLQTYCETNSLFACHCLQICPPEGAGDLSLILSFICIIGSNTCSGGYLFMMTLALAVSIRSQQIRQAGVFNKR